MMQRYETAFKNAEVPGNNTLYCDRLLQPPARGSLWRVGYNGTTADYDDHRVNCGGVARQYGVWRGRQINHYIHFVPFLAFNYIQFT